jgi:heme A synthase
MTARRDPPKDLSQQAHRRLIGFLGLLLPTLLYVVAALRPTDGQPGLSLLDSVSGYYYTGAVGIFVGILFALSLFLFTYPGYEGVIADRVVGWLGGASALGVALFPTAAPGGFTAPSWWSPWLRVVHYASAILLFTAFILFSIWLFRKSNLPKAQRPADKRRRDAVCLVCGITMIVSVLWAASALITDAAIFWPEAIAIVAFAVSWLVKGEAYKPVKHVLGLATDRVESASDGSKAR